MAVQAIPFGLSAFGAPYAVFNATSFGGWQNSSGTGGTPGLFGAPRPQQGVTSSLLSAQQDAIQATVNSGLSNLVSSGAWSISQIGGLFSGWGQNIADVNTMNAKTFQTAVNKSAKGCSGFLSCLFG